MVGAGYSLPRTMMTAAITGSGPLATLLCNSAEPSIVNGLRETARRCRDSCTGMTGRLGRSGTRGLRR